MTLCAEASEGVEQQAESAVSGMAAGVGTVGGATVEAGVGSSPAAAVGHEAAVAAVAGYISKCGGSTPWRVASDESAMLRRGCKG